VGLVDFQDKRSSNLEPPQQVTLSNKTKRMSSQTGSQPILTEKQREKPSLRWLDHTGRLMDNRFRIPGTNIRFGVDSLIGLIPGAGDILSFGISGMMVLTMVRNGVSGMVIVKMLGNVLLDTTIGAIPFIGDIFDLVYKSNIRNLQLMREHYEEDKHQGSAWPLVIGVLIALGLLLLFFLWFIWQVVEWFFGLF
jgi:hypothetical protein